MQAANFRARFDHARGQTKESAYGEKCQGMSPLKVLYWMISKFTSEI